MDYGVEQWTVADLETRAELSDDQFSVEAAPASSGTVLQGRMWAHRVRNGLTVVGAEVAVHGALGLAEQGEAGLALYLNVGEPRLLGTRTMDDHIVASGSLAAIGMRSGLIARERLREHQRLASVGITVTDALLDTVPDEDADQLRRLCLFVERGEAINVTASSRHLVQIGRQLQQPDRHGLLQGLHREAMALSFLVEAATLLHQPRCPTAMLIDRRIGARLDEVASLLEDGCEESTNFARLTHVAGMSAASLRRRFKARFGETLMEYARRCRLERSHVLLEKGDGTIAEIAWRCGYSDAANFTNAFRRHFGFTPGQVARLAD